MKYKELHVRIYWCVCAAIFCAGCTTRAVPQTLPDSSPASLNAKDGEAAAVTISLTQDPPMPGEESPAWRGLTSEAALSAPDAGHAHDHDAEEPRYVCPMHADVIAREPGKCHKCGMTLELIK
jgi:hypothetical protein